MQILNMNCRLLVIFGWSMLTCASGNLAVGDDYLLSQPLDEYFMVHEQLTSGESDEVPPEPVPPSDYQPLDVQAPELVAEEILRMRDVLGNSPLQGRQGFRPLTLANESDEHHAAPAPWEREDDRRHFRERLQGMVTRPIQPQPFGVPYGAAPYLAGPPQCVAQPLPHFYMTPPAVPTPYGLEPRFEVFAAPIAAAMAPAEGAHPQKRIDMLRQTAHQLDETAHQLECCEQFERADQVRKLADLLRQDARQVAPQQTTVMRSPCPTAACHDESIRAALRTRYYRTPVEAVEAESNEAECVDAEARNAEALDTEPSCPACPAAQPTSIEAAQSPLEGKLPKLKMLRSAVDPATGSSLAPLASPF